MHTQYQTTDGGGHQAFFGLQNKCKSPQQWVVRLFSTLLHSILQLKEEVPAGAKPTSLSPSLTTPKSNLPKPSCPAQLISVKNRIHHYHIQDSLCCSCWRPWKDISFIHSICSTNILAAPMCQALSMPKQRNEEWRMYLLAKASK